MSEWDGIVRSKEQIDALEEAAKIADGWLAVFADKTITYVSPHKYAADAVADIAEGIRALKNELPGKKPGLPGARRTK